MYRRGIATCIPSISAVLMLSILSGMRYAVAQDQSPDILAVGNLVLREDAEVGTFLCTLNVVSPQGNEVMISLVSDYFTLYAPNNTVYLTRPLCYQTSRFVQFTVTAVDRICGTTKQTFTVTVRSANLKAPVFQQEKYITQVDEDLPPNSVIFSIRIDDDDYGNSRLMVACIPNDNFQDTCNIFGLNEIQASNTFWEGQLINHSPLNYETVRDIYQVQLWASDGTHVTMKTLEIKIRHPVSPPVFLSLPSATLQSDAPVGSYITQVMAADSNLLRNRTIVYDIDGGQFFRIDLWSGVVTLRQAIDINDALFINGLDITIEIVAREVIDRQNAIYGSGPKTTSTGTIQITVIDATTNLPRFDAATYVAVVPENILNGQPLPGLSMLVSTANKDRNGRLTLVISDRALDEIFYIMPNSGVGVINATIYVRNHLFLDYEQGARCFDILVKAIYNRSYSDILTSNATVIVRVANVYDHPPMFDLPVYVILVSLTTRPGVIIGAIQAHSLESDQVFYSLSGSGSDKLVIGNTTGLLMLAKCPTASGNCLGSKGDSFNVTLTATDSTAGALRANTVLSIRINASTPQPPTFTSNVYYYYARVGSRTLSTMAPISATVTSSQSSTVIIYRLESGGYDGLFTINQTTGVLSTLKSVSASDIKANGQITFYVTASAGGATAVAQIIVQVQVSQAPGITFPQNYSASFSVNSPVGSTLIQVTALATNRNATITYGIAAVAGGDAGQFGINSLSGEILLAKNITTVGKQTYVVMVTASLLDGSASNATAYAYVSLSQSNISSPYFQPAFVNTTIPEDLPVGSRIMLLNAFTADDSIALSYGLAEPISAYDMAGNLVDATAFDPRSLVALVPSSGGVNVVLTASPNRKLATLMQITVTVKDMSTMPPLASGTATVVIQVKASSHSAPTFAQAEFVSTVDVSQAAGTYVTTLRASNNDSDTVAYSVYIEDVSNSLIIVDSITGIVTLRQPAANYQASQPMTTIVQVKNSADLKSFALAKVFVQTSAYGQLVFTQPYYVAILRDAMTSVVTVQATSTYPDGDYLPPQYDIQDESRFTVNAITGVVSTVGSALLGRSQLPYQLFYVTAFQVPRRKFLVRKSIRVPVYVMTPTLRFVRGDIFLTLPSNMPTGTDIAWAVAQSSNYSAVLSYSLAINPYDSYAIDSTSGCIVLVKPWPAGLIASHDIVARVRDPFGFSDTMTIHIIIAARNSPPYWLFPSDDGASVVVFENQPPNTIVTNLIQARDNDSRVTYGIATESGITTQTNEFFIDPSTGQIKTLIVLMADVRDKYLLNLAATDNINQTTTRFLYISVLRSSGIVNPVKFSKVDYYFYVPAGAAGVCVMNLKTSSCGRVTIMDAQNGAVVPTAQYVLAGGSAGCTFTINPNGTIYTMSASCVRNDSYKLLALVPGQSSSIANVHILISGSLYYASLPVGSPIGSKILDLNGFSGTPVIYSLGVFIIQPSDGAARNGAMNGSNFIYVDSSTGSVFLTSTLPPEWAGGYLWFTVIASDVLTGTVVDNSTVTVWIAGYNTQLQLLINGSASTTTIGSVTNYLRDLLLVDHAFVYSLTYVSGSSSVTGTSNRQFVIIMSVVDKSTNVLLTRLQLTKLIKDRSAAGGSSFIADFSIASDAVLQSAYIFVTSGLVSAKAAPPAPTEAYVVGAAPVAAGSSLHYGLAAAVALLLLLLCLLLPLIVLFCCCCPACCAALGGRSKTGLQRYAIVRRPGGLPAWLDMDGAEELEENEDYRYFGNDAFDEYDDQETRMDYVKTFLNSSSQRSAGAAATGAMEISGGGQHEQTAISNKFSETGYNQGMGQGNVQSSFGHESGENDRNDVIISGLAPGSTTLISELKQSAATSSAGTAFTGLHSASGQESASSSSKIHYAMVPRGDSATDAAEGAATTFSHTVAVDRPQAVTVAAARRTDHTWDSDEEEEEEEEESRQKNDGHSWSRAGGRGGRRKTVTETEIIEEHSRSRNPGSSGSARHHSNDSMQQTELDGKGSTGRGLSTGTLSASVAIATGRPLTVILDAQPTNQGMVAEDACYEIRPDRMALPDISAVHYDQSEAAASPAATGRYMVELTGEPLAPHLIPAVDEYHILTHQPSSPGAPMPSPHYR